MQVQETAGAAPSARGGSRFARRPEAMGWAMKRFVFALLPLTVLAQTADIINTYAGAGPNNLPATSAVLSYPVSTALDGSGNLYFVVGGESGGSSGSRVYKVNTSGTLTIVAGTGAQGYSGDGGPATRATLNPNSAAVDPSGNVYIAEGCDLRKVTRSTGIISTYAGNARSCGYAGDGGKATDAQLNDTEGVAVDSSGNVYVADQANQRIREVSASTGVISTIAGNGTSGFAGDGGAATSAELSDPSGVAIDGSGNVYIADLHNYRIRKVSGVTGKISTIAGSGVRGFSGDGGAGTSAEIGNVFGLASDPGGNVFIAEQDNCVIREVTERNGQINTVAGNYSKGCGYSGDGGAATSAQLYQPFGVAVNSSDTMFIADSGNFLIRSSPVGGDIRTAAGNAVGYTAPSTTAADAALGELNAAVPDAFGDVYIADMSNCVVWKATSGGVISIIAGTPPAPGNNYDGCGYSGDGGAATSAQLWGPSKAVPDSSGDVYIADFYNCVVRKVTVATGEINAFAGTPRNCGYSGDGGPASSAQLYRPLGVTVDSSGNVYIADSDNNVIREVSAATGMILTVAGNNAAALGYSGDGGPATSAQLDLPVDVTVDASGNLYIADRNNSRIRVVHDGVIDTFAGNGTAGYEGDGVPASQTGLYYPSGVAVDVAGDVLIADEENQRIRFVDAAGIIHTVAGSGSPGFEGDGEEAITSCPPGSPPTCVPVALASPAGIGVDVAGTIYIADTYNGRIREVTAIPNLNSSAYSLNFPQQPPGSASDPQQLTLTVVGPVTVSDITTTGDFTETNDCPNSLSSGQRCHVQVTFSPTALGHRTGSLTVATNSFFNNNVIVQLSGTGGIASFIPVPGALADVSVGADGSIWGLNGAQQIYMYNAAAQTWTPIPGLLTQIAAGSSTAVWGLNSAGQIYKWNGSAWVNIPGTLARIAVGADGEVWGLNTIGQIFHYVAAANTWIQIPGALNQISVGSAGAVYGVNAAGYIYWFNPGTGLLQQVTTANGFSEVSVGIDGDVWAVQNGAAYHYDVLHNTMDLANGASIAKVMAGSGANVFGLGASGDIFEWDAASQAWIQIPGFLSSIAVGANGTVWGVNSAQGVYRLATNSSPSYETLNTVVGTLAEVSVGADGSVWGVSSNAAEYFSSGTQSFETANSPAISKLSVGAGADVWGVSPSANIYQYNAATATWNNIPGELNLIRVGANGSVWGINAAGQIYTYNAASGGWTSIPGQLALPSQLPGQGGPLSVGADGTVWGINAAQQIYRFVPATQSWVNVPGALVQISVGDANSVWGINAAQQVYYYDPTGSWVNVPGALLVQISVAFDGSVWGVNGAGNLYQWDPMAQTFNFVGSGVTGVSVGNAVSVWTINAKSGAAFSWF